jgi:rSAM/selenodomain-associated transferase 2
VLASASWGERAALPEPRLSIVVPALNAGRQLGSCLAALAGEDEIIVVDGHSSDDTVAVALERGVRVVTAPRGRGTQLRAGAEAATGDWLLFVHADTRLAPEWRDRVARHIAARPDSAACLALRLDHPAWQARVIERTVATRVRLFALPYGDQGLLVPRGLYDSIGGFRALPLMEDVDLVWRIGRKRLARLDAAALTSADKWQRDGWLRRSARNLACLALYTCGVSAERIARLYR